MWRVGRDREKGEEEDEGISGVLYACVCVVCERNSRLIDESDPTLIEQHPPTHQRTCFTGTIRGRRRVEGDTGGRRHGLDARRRGLHRRPGDLRGA